MARGESGPCFRSARAAFLEADAEALLPAWFRDECPRVFTPPELAAQLARAPLWLRLQTDRTEAVEVEFDDVFPAEYTTALSDQLWLRLSLIQQRSSMGDNPWHDWGWFIDGP